VKACVVYSKFWCSNIKAQVRFPVFQKMMKPRLNAFFCSSKSKDILLSRMSMKVLFFSVIIVNQGRYFCVLDKNFVRLMASG